MTERKIKHIVKLIREIKTNITYEEIILIDFSDNFYNDLVKNVVGSKQKRQKKIWIFNAIHRNFCNIKKYFNVPFIEVNVESSNKCFETIPDSNNSVSDESFECNTEIVFQEQQEVLRSTENNSVKIGQNKSSDSSTLINQNEPIGSYLKQSNLNIHSMSSDNIQNSDNKYSDEVTDASFYSLSVGEVQELTNSSISIPNLNLSPRSTTKKKISSSQRHT